MYENAIQVEPVLSYETQIKPLFRKQDVNAMITFGGFDLHDYQDVSDHADSILARLEDGSMPCDAPWASENIETFRDWIEQGKQP